MLVRFDHRFDFKVLPKASPMAISIVLDGRSEQIKGQGAESLLEQASLYQEAENMLQEVRDLLSTSNAGKVV
jgi:ATP-dependent Lhr-like helicase